MSRVIADITASLDGYVTGPNAGPGNGLGDGGEGLHRWVFSDDPDDHGLLEQAEARSGAVVLGRSLFDVVDAPDGWSDTLGYGATEVAKPPFVVVTSSPPEHVRLTDLDWTFVTTGLVDAIAAAGERAQGRDVVLMGGGALIGSALAAGLVDTFILHLSPVILGAGTPLFRGGSPRALRQREVLVTTTATHLTYDLE